MTGPAERNAIEITEPQLLLVEGKDEELFFGRLLQSGLPAASCQVIALGKDGFRARLLGLSAAIREHPIRSLGVVRDALESAERALQSVRDALEAVRFPTPASHGEVLATEPRVGVFIMPDGERSGALEALCRRAVEAETAAACAEEYLACLDDRDGWQTQRSKARRDKGFVHAYLASRRDPASRVGEGARQGVWDFGHPAFSPIRDFLGRLL